MRGLMLMLALGIGSASGQSAAMAHEPAASVRVELVGGSAETLNEGYGRGFCANFTTSVDCVDNVQAGANIETFREQGLWDRSLAARPDYLVIAFEPGAPETSQDRARQVSVAEYEADLRQFVNEARAAGIKPVLCTPLARRSFGPDGKIHADPLGYAARMTKLATGLGVPLIDLEKESVALLDEVGEVKARALAVTKRDANGTILFDQARLNWAGSFVFGRIVARELGEVVPALRPFVLAQAAKLPTEGLKAMKVLEGGPVKIVLVGDSTVAEEGGWGPGFCKVMTPNVTCVDVALNGRSSKSFVNEGAWDKALALKGDYYLIQFGHNDQKPDADRHTDADGSFQTYLKRYASDARAIGAVPVLVTSLSRRTFKDGRVVEDLNDYAAATRKVGTEEGISVVDLNRLSTTLLDHMTQAQADQFDMTGHEDQKAENGAAAKLDRTHLNARGQQLFGRMVADELARTQLELSPDVMREPVGNSSR